MTKPLTASEMGKLGGKRSGEMLTPDQRKARAAKAGQARWKDATDEQRKEQSRKMHEGKAAKG